MTKMLLKLSGDEGTQLMNKLTELNTSLQNVVVAPGGPQGLTGPAGTNGTNGTNGLQGVQGITGIQGPQGVPGNNGVDGADGADSTVAGPKGDRGDQGVPGSVANETNILSRLTTLETYSPLINNSVGVVSDITYINKNEIILPSEIISNGVFSNTGTQTDWDPSAIAHMWYDASDASTITITNGLVTEWRDKTSNSVDLTTAAGFEPSMSSLYFNSLDAIDYSQHGNRYLHNTTATSTNPINVFSVLKCTTDQRTTFAGVNSIASTNNRSMLYGVNNGTHFIAASANTDVYINGINTGFSNVYASLLTPAIVNFEQNNTSNDVGFGPGKFHNTTGRCWRGVIGEVVVLNTTLTSADRSKIEGYLAHKWGISANLPSSHTYKNAKPIIGGVTLPNWTVTSGSLNTTLLSTNDAIQSGSASSLKITQSIVTTIDDVYELTINRSDTNTVSPLKIEFPLAVQNINTLTSGLTFDVAHGSKLRFKVLDSTNFSITINTVDNLPVITSLEMKKVILSAGTISESTNNTIFKLTGGSAWNTGTSSQEYINGQADGYVQFQMGRGDKDLKVGLVYADVDYAEADPFEMSFIGSNVEIEGSARTTYIAGDYFRINHNSPTNTIQYQKRDSSGVYQTFYTHSITTDGNHLYLDTSFYDVGGRINDVFFMT